MFGQVWRGNPMADASSLVFSSFSGNQLLPQGLASRWISQHLRKFKLVIERYGCLGLCPKLSTFLHFPQIRKRVQWQACCLSWWEEKSPQAHKKKLYRIISKNIPRAMSWWWYMTQALKSWSSQMKLYVRKYVWDWIAVGLKRSSSSMVKKRSRQESLPSQKVAKLC